jgi:protein SCO1/2
MIDRTDQSRPAARRLGRLASAAMLASLGVAALVSTASPAFAQAMRPAGDGTSINPSPDAKPGLLNGVGIDQKLDTQIPADLVFRDETGKQIRLGDYFNQGPADKKRPILFTLVYYGCPRLCTMVLNEMKKALIPVETLNPGRDYDIVIVSFDPREGPNLAFDKKAEYTRAFRRPGTEGGWHFLTGDETNIKALCDAIGFRYQWDEKHQQYVHAGGVMVLTPGGKTSKYFYGIDYVPRDLQLALMEAGNGKIGTVSDQVTLFCFMYDPTTGKYTIAIKRILQVFGGLVVLGMGLFMVRSFRRDKPGDAARRDAAFAVERSESSRVPAEPGTQESK